MKRSFNWILIIWALLLSISFLSCPVIPAGNDDPAENSDLIVSLIVHTDPVLTTDSWTLGARVSNISASTAAGISTLKYYLSTDAVLDIPGDTLIGSKAISSIGADSYADDVWSTAYSISQAGTWYIFAVADADSTVAESNEVNNTLSVQIIVNQPASVQTVDLTVTSITIPGTPKTTAETWELGARVSNLDEANTAGASTLAYYLSTDAVLDIPGDTLIGSKAIGAIAAGSFADDVWSTAYSIGTGGTWYIFAVADADSDVAESDEENNTLSASITINEAGPAPDLEVTSITVPGTQQATTDTWELGARISNIDATAAAGASTLAYYLSTDSVLDIPGDTLIGSKAIGAIAAGSYADDVWSTAYSISEGGTWYIFAVADADSDVAESDEGNNSLSESVIISYDRIVIETFSPNGASINYTDTYLALFNSGGDPSPETPYDDSDALAVDDNSNSNHLLYSYIDYTLGLAPGTYYIKVRGAASNQTGPYGIRVLAAPSASYSYFASTNPAAAPWDDSYENDDSATGGIPDSPLSIDLGIQEAWHNRALADSDIDWFILTLD